MIFWQLFLICIIGLINDCASYEVTDLAKDRKCSELSDLYVELGCTPVFSKTDNKCPIRYDCPFMKSSFDKRKCHYKSQVYNRGSRIRNSLIENSCKKNCQCKRRNERGYFSCSEERCFKHSTSWRNECIVQYEANKCCSRRRVCFNTKSLRSCFWNGTEYKEGQNIFVTDRNERCVCSKEFNGAFRSSDCNKIDCDLELNHMDRIYDKCAPVYSKSNNFCPIKWKCKSSLDSFVLTHNTTDPEMKCHYDNISLSVGDTIVNRHEVNTKCTCEVPPLVTCITEISKAKTTTTTRPPKPLIDWENLGSNFHIRIVKQSNNTHQWTHTTRW